MGQFADLHAEDDYGFRWACTKEHWEVVRWMVMDYGIEKSSTIEEMIKEYPEIQEYFRAREELQEIQKWMKEGNPFFKQTMEGIPEVNDEWATKKVKKL